MARAALFLHLITYQHRNMLSGDSGINTPDKSKEKRRKILVMNEFFFHPALINYQEIFSVL